MGRYTYLCSGCGPLTQARASKDRDAVRACPTCGEHDLVRQIDSIQALIGSGRTGSVSSPASEEPPAPRSKFAQVSNVIMDGTGMRFGGVHVGIDNSTVTNHPEAIELENGIRRSGGQRAPGVRPQVYSSLGKTRKETRRGRRSNVIP